MVSIELGERSCNTFSIQNHKIIELSLSFIFLAGGTLGGNALNIS